MKSVALNDESLRASDIVLITTDHAEYDYDHIVRTASLVIDTRNATRNITDPKLRQKIVLLGSGQVREN